MATTAASYKKLSHREHILELPDTYIGSTETHEEWRWIYDQESNKMIHKKIKFNPGFYKLFDEVVVNARDARVRSLAKGCTPVKQISISVKEEDTNLEITVENDGDGIPIEQHPEHKIWVPELIFGHLLTSGNYDKSEEKIVGGKNGYGGKCLGFNTRIMTYSGKEVLAQNINTGMELIGDDGTSRKVLDVFHSKGKLYKVNQAHAEPYVVNDQHILTLCMPDHKVILWSETENAWKVLWWNHKEKCIQQKKITVEKTSNAYECPECKEELSSSISRHYGRQHKGIELPKKDRKLPTFTPSEITVEVEKAKQELEEFCKSIPDDNTFDMDIQEYMKLNPTTKKRLSGVRGKCVQWPSQPVEIDPYILGLWLGDGLQTGYGFACYGEKDPEIVNAIEEWASNNNAIVKKSGNYCYRIVDASGKAKKGEAPFKKLLAKYNLVKNKHIPQEYLVNDRKTRLAVLAGIIDTDGTVTRNGTRVSISQGKNHEHLANQIAYLARSLGFSVSFHTRKTTYTLHGEKKNSIGYHMNISGQGLEEIPTRLPRKKCSSPVDRQTNITTGFLTIEEQEEGEYVGIKIDGNQRFLINDFTVTHNCTNVFSDAFSIDIRHPASSQRYQQTWTDHMAKCGKPIVKADKAKGGYVKVTYQPDLTRFSGFEKEDMLEVLQTRAVELAAMCGKEVKVSWNGTTIPSNTFEKYVKLFVKDQASVVYEQCGPRWEVAAVLSRTLFNDENGGDESSRAVSFVNGINTVKGGKHVDTVVRHVLGDFCEAAAKKKVPVKPAQIRDAVTFFVNATIVNPAFDSQTKETLTTAVNKFGSVFKTEGSLVTGLMKAGLLEEAQAALEAKAAKEAKKTDGAKKKTIRGLPKLEDALWAGTGKSEQCTLILTEGNSAATSAISGLNIVGREKFGVFPLKGKLLNVKDISQEKFNKNEELTAIKTILGLRQGVKYESKKDLRYGRVMIMADQDHDGSHIKGLLMNLFHTEWADLMKLGFLCSLATPLLKATRRKETISFYSMGEFDAWKEANNGGSGWTIKYYKGLGTSTKEEAKEWFERLAEIHYDWDETTDESISLAFHKARADDRKTWLASYDPKRVLDIGAGGHIEYTKFVHDELIHFSNADNIRSLPHLMDGLKPSQRKILFGCFKKGLRSEIKVAQLAGYVSEHAAYHHGEASLCSTIVGMAQTFVGSNNMNLLVPSGQFGSRLMGGKDAASARYIFTHLEPIADKLFRKEDQGILNYLDDDGLKVEPDYYLPTLPLLLVNGCVGIGTGFSTDIPPYNPSDLIKIFKERLRNHLSTLKVVSLKPWWQGFNGKVVDGGDGLWITKGEYSYNDDKNQITITELPVGVWTKDYKAFLDEYATSDEGKTKLVGFDDLYTDETVKFVLHLESDFYEDMKAHSGDFEKLFRLTSSWRTTNMVAFDMDMKITKYTNVGHIMESFYGPRLEMYEKRKESEIARLEAEALEADAKARFIKAVLEGSLELRRATDEQIMEAMKKHKLPAINQKDDGKESVDGWEYLLKLRMDRVKASAVKEQEEAVAVAMKALSELKGTTAAQLWLKDLEELEAAWTKMEEQRIALSQASVKAKTSKAKSKK